MSSNRLVFVFLSVIFCVCSAERVKDRQCSDDIEVELVFCDSLEQFSVLCASKYQFHCIESGGLLCTIFGLSFECDASDKTTFCPNPIQGIKEVMDRFYKQLNLSNVVIKLDSNNDRNGSLTLSDQFLHMLNLIEIQSITLINLNMTSMPKFSSTPGPLSMEKPKFLKKITISGNSIERLETRAFFDLPSLTSLDLQSNKIQHLAEQTFEKLDHLDELNLSNNLLRVIPELAFFELRRLKTLSIANNQLHLIEAKAPLQFGNLVNLELSSNELEEMPELSELAKLEFLTVNDNKIKNVWCDRIEPLQKLEIIELNGNRIGEFNCNLDRMLSLYNILLNRNLLNSLNETSLFGYLKSNNMLAIKGNPLDCRKIKWLTNLKNKFLSISKATCHFNNSLHELSSLKELADHLTQPDQSSGTAHTNWHLLTLILGLIIVISSILLCNS